MSAPRFIAYRGLDSTIQNLPIMPNLGYVYFATDTGKIYMDYYDKRLVMGSTGASLLYADAESPEVDEFGKYSLSWDDLEDQKTEPKIDDLILNSDGSFYRVEEIFPVERIMYGARVTVSGSGTGPSGPSTDKQASIKIGQIKNLNLINGQDFDIPITGTAEYQDGEPVDESIFINYEIYVADDQGQPVGTPYVKSTMPAKTGVETVLKAGPMLRHSTRSTFKLWVTSSNGSRPSRVNTSIVVYCDNLELKKSSEFSNLSVFSPDGISVKCLAVGNMGKILKYTWDDEVLYTDRINANDTRTEFSYTIPASYATHGLHILKIDLYQRTTLDEEGKNVGPLIYEIAVAEPDNMKPIIWLGDYKNEYKNYDNIKIPFLVYDPSRRHEGTTEVNFYKRGINLEIPRVVSCTAQNSKYNYFEITDADHNMENFYSISCGDKAVPEFYDERPIRFSLVTDDRDMTLAEASQIIVNFSARGRSNNEAASRRASWSQEVNGTMVKGIFNNFNWKNNGWMMEAENDNETCLRISNGASFKIPFGNTTMASGTNPSAAFEMQFKIRNVQDYGNLIQNITRYIGDDLFYTYGFTKQTEYTNYDAFLNDFLRIYPLDGVRDEKGELVTDDQGNTLYYPVDENGDRISYDDLKFSRIQKNIDLSKTICKYISGSGDSVVGFALGTQDCFFSNGSNKVTAPYVEDEMVNLTIVYTHSATSENSRLMTIYVNGMMTGVINSTVSSNDGFTIESEGIEFNSTYCDIDLFKFRAYKNFLTVKNVVKNFAVDRLDVDVYDQNNLAELDPSINEYRLIFQHMLDYNELREKNNEEPLMPYIIFDTSNSSYNDKLSWSKSTDIPITVTFKNTGLDYAYATGELERLLVEKGIIGSSESYESKQAKIKHYYQHHCPSWTGNYVNMAVQGTSSEFYPRRNYKLKTKTSHDPRYEDDVVNIHLNAGPFEKDYETDPESTRQDFFYMNNEVVGTTKFTMKIDYMESSGTYNMGFANLVGNAYAKHPLAYYDEVKAFQDSETSYVAATGAFDPNKKYFILNNNNKYTEDKTVTEDTYDTSRHYVERITYTDINLNIPGAYRTSVQGYPVLAFHKKSDGSCHYIGRYNMLLDKGSDECFGFKPSKTIVNKFILKNGVPQAVRKTAECWEFSNNSRTYCSFKDPQNRYNLSFKVDAVYDSANPPKKEDGTDISKEEYEISGALNSVRSCPIVSDSFEYRYHDAGDTFDYIYDPVKNSDKMADAQEELGDGLNDIGERSEFLYKKYTNWEKAVQWVWSTNEDYVGSENIYEALKDDNRVGAALYEKGKYYIRLIDAETGNYSYVISNDDYNSSITYYNKKELEKEDGTVEETYENAYIVPVNAYEPGKYFIRSEDGSYVLDYSSFDSSVQYYSATKINFDLKTDEELLALNIYKLTPPSGVDFKDWEGITYNNKTYYRYDTKEYRAAKFRNELNKHFNSEYLSTYFVMTEVFECYDSRGKNAMFASWGPMEEGGDYIWFPLFYDIDTQLGINNTGIPSFEYSIDATIEGTFSTSDSILWNNYYKHFKAEIIQKYKQLKGENSSYAALAKPPLSSVNNIRQWYKADPVVCDNMAMRGQRPLIALNLDEYYKYLTIMNNADLTTGKTGYIDGGGNYITDNGTYLYALQGDRDLYITQFITNRIDYIDSWLNVGNYQRGGANNIWGRMAANNKDKISDLWVEKAGEAPYFDASGNKVNEFDAEYWATVTPIRKTYVTVQDDNGAYPSIKYNGSPVKVYYTALESGVRSSANYPEQLVYIYGIDSMGDIGDISKMYWQEFKIVGNAKKLRKLQYGYDALMTDAEGNVRMFDADDPVLTASAKVTYGDDPSKVACRWYNSKVNPPSMPSGKEDSGMPLLQEANFSNIMVNTNSPSLNLTSCEKLQNFRATGSNFTSIKFADGVALTTLYLPRTLLKLELTEARLLDHIIQTYEYPVKNKNTNNLEAKKGLYIEGFTDCGNGVPYNSSLNTINIIGDSLKYDSYILMNKLKEKQVQSNAMGYLTLTDVKWSPYELLTEGDIYDNTTYDYYIDNNHYGVAGYAYNENTFELDILNGKLYRKAKNAVMDTIKDIEIFKYFLLRTSKIASATSSSQSVPNISGIIYIDNEEEVDEVYIKNSLVANFPSLTFIFKKVKPAYSAKFLIPELIFDEATDSYINSGVYKYAPLKNNSKEPSVQKISEEDMAQDGVWFTSPYDLYTVEKTNFVFDGWGYYDPYGQIIPIPEAEWENFKNSPHFDSSIFEYEFHALFTIHQYQITYHNTTYDFSTGNKGDTIITIPYGEYLELPDTVPITDESTLPDNKRYRFVGYSSNSRHYIFSTESEAKANKVEPQTMIADSNRDFYAMYIEEDATLVASPNEYFDFTLSTTGYTSKVDDRFNIASGYTIKPKAGTTLAGKITIPSTYNDLPVFKMISNWSSPYLTHVYFLENGKNMRFVSGFSESQNLRIFDFPSGCNEIENNAFTKCNKLIFTEKFNQMPLGRIGDQAFQGAFNMANRQSEDLLIPASLYHLGSNAIRNLAGYNDLAYYFNNLRFGDTQNPFDINKLSGSIKGSLRQNTSINIANIYNTITFYLATGTATEENKTSIYSFLKKAMEITTDITGPEGLKPYYGNITFVEV